MAKWFVGFEVLAEQEKSRVGALGLLSLSSEFYEGDANGHFGLLYFQVFLSGQEAHVQYFSNFCHEK